MGKKKFGGRHKNTLSDSAAARQTIDHHLHLLSRYTSGPVVNISGLREASKFGFVNNALRRKIWPLLLGLDEQKLNWRYAETITMHHAYYDQVNKDIARSLFHFDIQKAQKLSTREANRKVLAKIVHAIFSSHPGLHYIQGFHDICSVFLVVCGDDDFVAFALCERLALLHIRDSLRSSLDVILQVLALLFPLLKLSDPVVCSFLEESEAQSFFTLSWVLTWFSHNFESFEAVARMFDFLLASHPLMSLYLSVALIIHLRSLLLSIPAEMCAVHQFFQSLPKDIDVPAVISSAHGLFTRFPPSQLFTYANVKLPADSPLTIDSFANLFKSLERKNNHSSDDGKEKSDKQQPSKTTVMSRRSSSLTDYLAEDMSDNGTYCGEINMPASYKALQRQVADSHDIKKEGGRRAVKPILLAVIPVIFAAVTASVSWMYYGNST